MAPTISPQYLLKVKLDVWVLTGPGLLDVDISLLKNHRWRERFNLQFRLEALNCLNHPNFFAPGRTLGASDFGVISSARDGRTLQLGLKLEF